MKNIILFILFVLGGVNMVHAQGNNYTVRASIDVAYMFCDFKVNGVSSFDNRQYVFFDKGIVTTNTNVQMLIENGVNNIELEVAPISWFSDNNGNKEFDKDAVCNVSLYITENSTDDLNYVAKIKIEIDKEGNPIAYSFNKTDDSIKKSVAYLDNTEKVTNNKIRYVVGEFEYPKDMEVVTFKKDILFHNIPDWLWVKSEPYDESKINSLKSAYEELWHSFNDKDINKIKELNSAANNAWAISNNSTEEAIFKSYDIIELINEPSSKMIPIDWDNFKVILMNKGRMVKLVYKEDFSYSPITMTYKDENGDELLYSFSPIFSFVNGKFIPVI
ncbi:MULTISPECIES: hypothetical protein [Providencia]|uniref:hypothetical protein n=1 Tax=Providencia TaxID=586 RepID=UPI0015EBBFBA|nr:MULTISPECIES: hypothetical protein [Providencia]MBI6188909.1 hypothetical protein [Providencia rettgeri]QLQ66036.1 hypothetical protein H0904_06485 [Providencia rettgeri]URR22250.1 hypothetical protein L3Q80_18385 [Providencia rettgeri]